MVFITFITFVRGAMEWAYHTCTRRLFDQELAALPPTIKLDVAFVTDDLLVKISLFIVRRPTSALPVPTIKTPLNNCHTTGVLSDTDIRASERQDRFMNGDGIAKGEMMDEARNT